MNYFYYHLFKEASEEKSTNGTKIKGIVRRRVGRIEERGT